MKRWLVPLAVLFVILTLWQIQSSSGQAPEGAAAENAAIDAFKKECSGKIVVVSGLGADGHSVALADARLRELAGRRYLQGSYTHQEGSDTGLEAAPTFIQWDAAKEILLLTPEQYQKWLESAGAEDASS